MIIFLIGLIVFLGIHCVRIVAPEWREAQITARGIGTWKGIYSIASIISLVVLIYGYSLWRGDAAEIYEVPQWGRSSAFIIMLFVFIATMVGNLKAGFIKEKIKHPMLIATILWCIAYLLANGDAATLTLMAAFLAWGIVNFISATGRDAPAPVSTGYMPDVISVVSATAIWAAFIFFLHDWLIGVPLTG